MSWKPEVDEIARRRRLAEKMGGTEKVAIHHQSGKLTARERIVSLIDPGSFQEIGALTGAATYDASGNLIDFTPANVVIGQGRIDGRRVVFSGDLIAGEGKVTTWFDLHWDYYGFTQGTKASATSFERVRGEKADVLLPSHGNPIDEPEAAA